MGARRATDMKPGEEPRDAPREKPWSEAPVQRWQAGVAESGSAGLVVEAPLEYHVDGDPVATVMRTPGDDLDLAAGFFFAEGLIDSARDVATLCRGERPVEAADDGETTAVVSLTRAGGARRLPGGAGRYGPVQSSCGVCGKRTVEEILGLVPPLTDPPRPVWLSPRDIARFMTGLEQGQPIFARTGAVHAAAIFDLDGTPLAVKEDIGRHNAVDKAIGRLLRSGRLPLEEHVLVVSGRASFEIVQKALRARAPVVLAVSGVSQLAAELAERGGITLCGFARESGFTVYSRQDRIRPEDVSPPRSSPQGESPSTS